MKLNEICFRLGLRPRPTGGAYDAPPDHLVGRGGGTPHRSPHSAPFDLKPPPTAVKLKYRPAMIIRRYLQSDVLCFKLI